MGKFLRQRQICVSVTLMNLIKAFDKINHDLFKPLNFVKNLFKSIKSTVQSMKKPETNCSNK